MADKDIKQVISKLLKKNKGKKISISSVVVLIIIAALYFSPLGDNLKNETIEPSSGITQTSVYEKTDSHNETEAYVTIFSGYEGTSYYSTESAYTYEFRNRKRLNEHFEKHGAEVGASSADEYEKMASAVVTNSNSLHKTEAEDGDDVYFLKSTGEFVIVSPDGYLRTYYIADYDYFNRQ